MLDDLPPIPISTNGYLIVRDPKVKLGFEVKSGFAFWRLDKAVLANRIGMVSLSTSNDNSTARRPARQRAAGCAPAARH